MVEHMTRQKITKVFALAMDGLKTKQAAALRPLRMAESNTAAQSSRPSSQTTALASHITCGASRRETLRHERRQPNHTRAAPSPTRIDIA
jgi:hypothetical protein